MADPGGHVVLAAPVGMADRGPDTRIALEEGHAAGGIKAGIEIGESGQSCGFHKLLAQATSGSLSSWMTSSPSHLWCREQGFAVDREDVQADILTRHEFLGDKG